MGFHTSAVRINVKPFLCAFKCVQYFSWCMAVIFIPGEGSSPLRSRTADCRLNSVSVATLPPGAQMGKPATACRQITGPHAVFAQDNGPSNKHLFEVTRDTNGSDFCCEFRSSFYIYRCCKMFCSALFTSKTAPNVEFNWIVLFVVLNFTLLIIVTKVLAM